jgi:hypothetical protein
MCSELIAWQFQSASGACSRECNNYFPQKGECEKAGCPSNALFHDRLAVVQTPPRPTFMFYNFCLLRFTYRFLYFACCTCLSRCISVVSSLHWRTCGQPLRNDEAVAQPTSSCAASTAQTQVVLSCSNQLLLCFNWSQRECLDEQMPTLPPRPVATIPDHPRKRNSGTTSFTGGLVRKDQCLLGLTP